MFFKNNLRPAYAAASASDGYARTEKKHAAIFSAADGEADDFNAFGSSQSTERPKKSGNAPKKKGGSFEFNLKYLLIAAASVVAVILLIIIIVAVANSSGGDLKKENNAFAVYEQDGLYYVAMNGDVIGSGYENELTITPAADNSFAYVVEDTPDGYYIYILEKKELTAIVPTPITEVITFAAFEPGVVYRDNEAIYYYANESEDRITKNASAGNFVISPDAKAVAYTLAKKDDVTQFDLMLYRNGISDDYADNFYPVSVSNGGEYLYAYGISTEELIPTKKLYVIVPEENDRISIESSFNAITYTNVKGDEIIYYTTTADETGNLSYTSYIYNAKKGESHKIGAGICTPLIADPNVACLASLKDIVVENIFNGAASSATYLIDKKYESRSISKYNGTLNTDGDTFYYISTDGRLNFIDLNDKNRTPQKIADGVEQFVVTEKDNVYYLDEDDRLMFWKASSGQRKSIAVDATNISMNRYSNILYFDILDDTKAYMTEEGSGKEIAEFSRVEIPSAPGFTDATQKRTFAYIVNPDTGLYDVYYTSTGKTYKLLASGCGSINDFEPGFDMGDIGGGNNNSGSNSGGNYDDGIGDVDNDGVAG